MDSLSHDSVAGDIANQMVDIGSGGLESGAAAVASLTGLIPAGSEEVSMQAALAFATQGAQMLAANTAAQQELMSAGMTLMQIATNYANVDDEAAGTLVFGAAVAAAQRAAGRIAAGISQVGAMRGLSGAAAGAPLLAGVAEAPLATGAAGAGGTTGTVGTVSSAGSTALGAGAAPLGAMQSAQSGSSKPGMPAALVNDHEDSDPAGRDEQLPGERRV